MLGFTDFIVIFKTSDTVENVKKKCEDWPQIMRSFYRVRSGKKFMKEIVKLR
jgi:hypothetical protein